MLVVWKRCFLKITYMVILGFWGCYAESVTAASYRWNNLLDQAILDRYGMRRRKTVARCRIGSKNEDSLLHRLLDKGTLARLMSVRWSFDGLCILS